MHVVEFIGWSSTALAMLGVWFNNRQSRICFGLWLVSNAMTLVIHVWAALWSLAARDAAFFVMAIHGWLLWSRRLRLNASGASSAHSPNDSVLPAIPAGE